MSRDGHLAQFRRPGVSGAQPLDPARGACLMALVDGTEGVTDVWELVALIRPDGAGAGG